MTSYPSDVAFTPTVKAIQETKGSRGAYSKMEKRGGWRTTVTPDLAAFLARLDMFYLGTSNAEGQPYIQYRGGPVGFLRVIDDRTLGFADFAGNQQYVTLGNLADNPKAFLFLMDYENRRRIKVWGKARAVEDDAGLLRRLADPDYAAQIERAILFEIDAWDVNCPQHLFPRVRLDRIDPEIHRLKKRIAELESRLAEHRPQNGAPIPSAPRNS